MIRKLKKMQTLIQILTNTVHNLKGKVNKTKIIFNKHILKRNIYKRGHKVYRMYRNEKKQTFCKALERFDLVASKVKDLLTFTSKISNYIRGQKEKNIKK